jgi:hypothetical protein
MITAAALQLALSGSETENIEAVSDLIEQAAAKGAQIVLPPELFSGPYFCKTQDEANFALARPTGEHPSVKAMTKLAKTLGVAIPTSFFERDGSHYYNSLAMIGPDGEILGLYRKSHIPDGPGYQEKYYFRPGNTGFKVWQVFGTTIGVGICWDQWHCWGQRCCSIRPQSEANLPKTSIPVICGGARWLAMPFLTRCLLSLPTASAPKWIMAVSRRLFTAPASSQMKRATSLPTLMTAKPGYWLRASIWIAPANTARRWDFSETAGLSFTVAW